jgi:predicted metal-dependent hydrolase
MMNNRQLILAFVRDLNFISRIESAASGLGFQVVFVETAEQIASKDVEPIDRQFAEHLKGRGAILLDKITQWQPLLIIFDLTNDRIPWFEWISLVASVPATRRIPILCYGSHVDLEGMKAARKAGAIAVVTRSRFVTNLPQLLQKCARFTNSSEIEQDYQEPLSPSAMRGLEEFNNHDYFAARESLKKAWLDEENKGQDLFRTILQISAAYSHILNGNFNGAAKMFLRVRQWIDPLPDFCKGINVKQLRQNIEAVYQQLLALGPERIDEFDIDLLMPVEFKDEY